MELNACARASAAVAWNTGWIKIYPHGLTAEFSWSIDKWPICADDW